MSESADSTTGHVDGPVRVEVTRSGGFAGVSRHVVLDAATLPPAEASRVALLAEAVQRAGTAAAAPGGADRFSYDVTISRGAHQSRHSYGEMALPADARALVDLVLNKAGGGSAS